MCNFRYAALAGACLVLNLLGNTQGVWATNIYLEAVDGDISDDRLAPTFFALDAGQNNVVGSASSRKPNTPPPGDLDYLWINVPVGMQLVSLNLDGYADNSPFPDNSSFIGIQAGTSFSVDAEPPGTFDPADLLGYTIFGLAQVGTDLLPAMGQGLGSMMFTPPLAAGDYTLWIQEAGTPGQAAGDPSITALYNFRFAVAVPEPSSLLVGVLASGGGVCLLHWRRRQRR